MLPNRILIIGGMKKNIQKAKSLGLEVMYIQKTSLFDNGILEYVDQVFLFDYENLNELTTLVKSIYQVFPFQAVASMSERGLIPAAHVNDVLGLKGKIGRAHV